MTTGRRKERRYRAIEDIFVVTKSKPGVLGNILDISNQGLSFHSIANGEFTAETFKIDLFLSKNGFLTKKIYCKKVFERTEYSRIPFSTLKMRRVGVIFINLNPNQFRQVEHFINHLTDGQVVDRRCGLDRRSNQTNMTGDPHNRLNYHDLQSNKNRRHSSDRRI